MSFEKATQKILKYLDQIPDKCDKEFDTKTLLNVTSGKVDVIGIVNNDFFSISKLINYPNSSTEWHTHEEMEHFILINGDSYIIETEENGIKKEYEVTLEKNCFILPNVSHRMKISKNYNESLIVLIPGSDFLPAGMENQI